MRNETGWFKSSHSAPASDNCVEARIAPAEICLRDSTHPHNTTLTLDTSAWQDFLKAIRSDELQRRNRS